MKYLIYLVATLLASMASANSDQDGLSPEAYDLIHNQVHVGPFSMSRKEFSEAVNLHPSRLSIYAIQAGSSDCKRVLNALKAAQRVESSDICNQDEEGYVTISEYRPIQDFETWDRVQPLDEQAWLEKTIDQSSVMNPDELSLHFNPSSRLKEVYSSSDNVEEPATNPVESLLVSMVVSSSQTEEGHQALIDPGALQDLVIQPVVGSVLGLALMSLGNNIEKNDGRFLGSNLLGKLGMFATNPQEGIENALIKLSDGYIEEFEMGPRVLSYPGEINYGTTYKNEQLFGFGFDIWFGGNK